MSGSVPFEEALAARLSLFNPSLSQVQNFLETRPPRYNKVSFGPEPFFLFSFHGSLINPVRFAFHFNTQVGTETLRRQTFLDSPS